MESAKENKLSLSKKIGVSHSTVGRWLQGSEPKADQIPLLAKALAVNAQWLLTGQAQEKATESPWMVRESPEQIEDLLSDGPEGAAMAMSEEQLQHAIMEWAAMLPKQQRYMQRAILGNLALFIRELRRRLANYDA